MRRTIAHEAPITVHRVTSSGDTERVPMPVRVAVALVGIEALALLGTAVFVAVDSVVGHPHNAARALLGAAFALLGAVALGLAARGLLRLNPSSRSPVVVLQLLALPVGYSMAFQANLVAVGGPLLVIAVAVLYLLFTPPARAALDREPPGR
jgi:hypothetical protein